MNKFTRFVVVAMALAMLLAVVVGGATAQGTKTLVTGINMTNGDPETLDPGLAQDTKEVQIINELFIGMTVLDETTSEVRPGIASSWDVSPDGMTYTFHLIKGIPWVHYNATSGAVEQLKDDSGNPRVVTANDIVYAWKRNLDPATASPYTYVVAPYVVGGEDFQAGKGTADGLGIKALDDNTVQITSPKPGAFLANIYGMWFNRPLPQWAIEDAGTAWTEPENIATYGPFAFKEWKHDESATLVKNPFWPGTKDTPQPKLDEVVIRFLDAETQFPEYQAGTMVAIELPPAQIDAVKADATLSKERSNGTQDCTYYYGFNNTKAPFDNAHMRLAFSYAIDRQSIVDNVTKGGQIPARWYTRPGNTGAPAMDAKLGIGFDPQKAKDELALAMKDMNITDVKDIPHITLAFGNTPTHNAIAQAIAKMWQDNLGIQVGLSALDTTTYFSVQREDSNQIFRAGWCADYPDANNWLNETMHTGVAQNYGKFSNPDFDKLVEQAAVESDPAKRADMYAQAEDILVSKDAGIAPIYWYVTNQLTKPTVERTYSQTGAEVYEKWDLKG